MIGQTVSHYRIEEQLGQGGMGVVYRAVDTKLDRNVALKFLPPALSSDPDSKERFIREAKAASGLDHPNICTIHEIGETDDGRLFIAMSYYDGQTLKYRLKNGALSISDAASIASQIAEGLTKAHAAGIVHRDIKPANIMVTAEGRVKILDFGVAKLGEGADLTRAGSTVGTLAYMSPEQARGEKVDSRSDLWSLGVLFYEMLSGAKPFGGEYDHAISYAILNEDPLPLGPDIPGALRGISQNLLAKKAEDRFESAADVVRALEPWSGRAGSGTVQVAAPRSVNPLIWAVPIGVVVLVAVVWMVLRRGGEAAGDEAANSANTDVVAVLPFSVRAGPELQDYGESMVTLLSSMLDGAGEIRVTDPNGVIGYVQRQEDLVLDPVSGKTIAAAFGAGRFILGSILKAGVENRMTATLYDANGAVQQEASSSFTSDEDFMPAVDALASDLVGGMLTNADEQLGTLAAGTTTSFEALKHYLDAEAALRRAEYQKAYDEADAAVTIDSTFALALYVKASAMGWLGAEIQRKSYGVVKQAARHVSGLNRRARDLITASLAFDEGRPSDAEAIYRRMLSERPNDLEAIGELAETLVHYDYRESRQDEALGLMEELTRFDPDNSQRVMHFADGYATLGQLTGDYRQLDSLVASMAGLPVPPTGQRLNWTEALQRLNADQRRYVVQYALVRGSPSDSAAILSRFRDRSEPLRVWQLGWTGHVDAAQALFSVMRESQSRRIRLDISSSFAGTRGQLRLANACLDSLLAFGDGSASFVWNVLTKTLPAYEARDSDLAKLAEDVRDWTPTTGSNLGHVVGNENVIKSYLMGLIAWRRGDEDGLRENAEWIRTELDGSAADAYRARLLAELDGLIAWSSGNLREAEGSMERALPSGEYFLDIGSDVILGRPQPYWFLGEILAAAGRMDEAIDWFSFRDPYEQWRFLAPQWERMAQLYDRLGQSDKAIQYYGLFADMWKKADPELQPRVQAARERIGQLLDAKAREPS